MSELFFEFLTWAIEKSKELYNEDIDIKKMVNHSMSEIGKGIFLPPQGSLILAKEGNQVFHYQYSGQDYQTFPQPVPTFI